MIGNTPNATIALKKIDSRTFEAIQKVDGKVVSTNRNSVSKDGKVMTQTARGVNTAGQTVNNVLVFGKQ